MRKKLISGIFCVFIVWFVWSVVQAEQQKIQGEEVLFDLAPVDPRSLLQGDYMILRLAIETEIAKQLNSIEDNDSLKESRQAVFSLSEDGTPQLGRIHRQGIELRGNEKFLNYKVAGRQVTVGPGSFFFQEGKARIFSAARFARMRVQDDGTVTLLNLLDADKKLIE